MSLPIREIGDWLVSGLDHTRRRVIVGALAQADAIRSKPLGFSGAVELDHADDHLRLLEATHLGQEIELVVTCRVASKGFTHPIASRATAKKT